MLKNAQNQILISLDVAAGVYNSQQLKTLADLAESEGIVLKATEEQQFAFAVDENKIPELTKKMNDAGLLVNKYQSGVRGPTSCLGEMCPLAAQETLSASMEIQELLQKFSLPENKQIRIGINACAKSCVPSHTFDISITGEESGYRLAIGGKNTIIPEFAQFLADGLSFENLKNILGDILVHYQNNSSDNETLDQMIERNGMQKFNEMADKYSQPETAEEKIELDISPKEQEISLDLLEDIQIQPDQESIDISVEIPSSKSEEDLLVDTIEQELTEDSEILKVEDEFKNDRDQALELSMTTEEEEDISLEDDFNLSIEESDNVLKFENKKPIPSSEPTGDSLMICGFDFDSEKNEICIEFSNGGVFYLNAGQLESREFNVFKTKINLEKTSSGISVNLNGLRMEIPTGKAAGLKKVS